MSQGEFAASVTDSPSAAIVPSVFALTDGAGGGVLITGMNSSTVMIVTMSVVEFSTSGPLW